MMPSPYACAPFGCRVCSLSLIGFLVFEHAAAGFTLAKGDAIANLKAFSDLSPPSLRKLQEGEIHGEPGSLMNYPNGFSAETCFAVPVPAGETASRLQLWNPSLHPTLKAIEFHELNKPCTAADFEALNFKPGNHPLQWLLDKSMATTAHKSDLNLSRLEASRLGACVNNRPDPKAVAAWWDKLLLERASAFQRDGFAGVAPYDLGSQAVSPSVQLRKLVQERPAVSQEFASMLRQSGVLGDAGPVTLKAFYYSGIYEANSRGTLTLGVVYLLPLGGDHYQLLDAQYYVSGTYYTSITLYEVWPVPLGDKPGALVWRGDFLTAPTLSYAKGLDRLAYGTVMLQELKKTIRCFQDDVHRSVGDPK